MSKLKDLAKNAVAMNTITTGKTKISVDTLIAIYPEGVTINAFDIVNSTNGKFPVFSFEEDTTKFFTGGKALTDMVNSWIDSFDGNIATVNEELKNEPVKIKMEKIKTQNNRTFTKIEIVDE